MRYFDSSLMDKINGVELSLSAAGRATVGRDWRGEVVSPEVTRLYYIWGGSGLVRWKGGEMPLEGGAWYLLPSGLSFEYECAQMLDHTYFHIKVCNAAEPDLLCQLGKPLKSAAIAPPTERICARGELVCGLKMKFCACEALFALLLECGIELKEQSFSRCITDGVRFVRNNLSATLSSGEIAEAVLVSKSTLEKHFRSELGVSVGEFVDGEVLAEARRLLYDSALSVREVSEAIGFADQFYFSKKFKARFGISPREYRKAPFV